MENKMNMKEWYTKQVVDSVGRVYEDNGKWFVYDEDSDGTGAVNEEEYENESMARDESQRRKKEASEELK